MQVGYYPGCALHGSSNDYEMSVRACLSKLQIDVREIDDWICCGASAAHSLNQKLSVALPARTLGLAERDGLNDILAPCPMCSMELCKAGKALAEDPELRVEISDIVELEITGKSRVLNLIQVLQEFGVEKIQSLATRSLSEFKPACYYGCLLTRPPKVLKFDDCEQPESMEKILGLLGAVPVDWNFKTECCGAGMTLANEDTVLDLSHKIISDAIDHGANCLVVACPMCHVNLDMKQAAVKERFGVQRDMVVYYLSDLVGIAMGIDEKDLGVDRHYVVKD